MCSQRRPGRRKVISVAGAPPSRRRRGSCVDGAWRTMAKPASRGSNALGLVVLRGGRAPPPVADARRARGPGPSGRRRRGRCGRRTSMPSTSFGPPPTTPGKHRRRRIGLGVAAAVGRHPDEDQALALGDRIARARGCGRVSKSWPSASEGMARAGPVGARSASRDRGIRRCSTPSASRRSARPTAARRGAGRRRASAKTSPARRAAEQHRLAQDLVALQRARASGRATGRRSTRCRSGSRGRSRLARRPDPLAVAVRARAMAVSMDRHRRATPSSVARLRALTSPVGRSMVRAGRSKAKHARERPWSCSTSPARSPSSPARPRASARRSPSGMAEHGAKVVISSRKAGPCEEVAAAINAKHPGRGHRRPGQHLLQGRPAAAGRRDAQGVRQDRHPGLQRRLQPLLRADERHHRRGVPQDPRQQHRLQPLADPDGRAGDEGARRTARSSSSRRSAACAAPR